MAADSTLIRIRERSFPDLLDLGLVVARNRPRPILLASLAGIAPFAAFNAWISTDPEFPFFFFLILLALEAPWATAPLTVVLGKLMFGQPVGPGPVARALWRGLPAMILHQGILRALLLLPLLTFPILPGKLALMNEVILLEQSRMSKVVKRTSELCRVRGTDLFGQWLGQFLVGGLFAICFWAGIGAATNALTSSVLTWEEPGWADLLGLRFQLGVWLAIGYFGVVRFLTYIDQRIRLEGWEVKQRLMAAGRAIEEAGSW